MVFVNRPLTMRGTDWSAQLIEKASNETLQTLKQLWQLTEAKSIGVITPILFDRGGLLFGFLDFWLKILAGASVLCEVLDWQGSKKMLLLFMTLTSCHDVWSP